MTRTTNLTGSGAQTIIFEEPRYFSFLVNDYNNNQFISQQLTFSITASLGNTLTLVSLHKESSLHPPSKLFSRRCPATTDMLVALVTQPLHATHWMSVVYRHQRICRYVLDTALSTSCTLCGVSLLTLTAMIVDRLLALLLIQTDKM